ncbi:hypothetical protein Pcinc_038765 [Petrolisthes cinctipes]|uniref:Uncharacterized protein n=1 Tax=Petrolisthes cinctipes TaxID=88211 RepID=A0AAE1EL91_PETCI|nr:hypothetical protein Pcinc_038765 [Petrolisthes cinctipes]
MSPTLPPTHPLTHSLTALTLHSLTSSTPSLRPLPHSASPLPLLTPSPLSLPSLCLTPTPSHSVHSLTPLTLPHSPPPSPASVIPPLMTLLSPHLPSPGLPLTQPTHVNKVAPLSLVTRYRGRHTTNDLHHHQAVKFTGPNIPTDCLRDMGNPGEGKLAAGWLLGEVRLSVSGCHSSTIALF